MKSYLEAENPNAEAEFPYLVREVVHGMSTTFDPAFHTMHWHSDVQFLYVEDGTVDVETLGAFVTVKKNEAIFLAPNVVHCIRATQTAHYYNFLFPSDQLRFLPGSPANDDLEPVLDGMSLPLCPLTDRVPWQRDAIARLEMLVRFTKTRPPAYAATILVTLFTLALSLRTHATLAPSTKTDDIDTVRTRRILQYIAAHYAEDITLDALAACANCSKSACLRAFRARMKTTPYKYLIEYRLEQAALMLRQTNEPAYAIAEAVGFHHVSLFGKSFKAKTSETPKAYRTRHAKRSFEEKNEKK